MKKISLLIITLTTFASAQLRVGIDLNGGLKGGGGFEGIASVSLEQTSKLGIRVGYEKTLFGIAGVGAEYFMSQVGDAEMKIVGTFLGEKISESETIREKVFPNALMGYGLVRIPLSVPFLRGIIRAGMWLPMGSGEIDDESFKWIDAYDPAITWGIGIRAKLPVMPIGAELLYQSMTLSATEIEGGEDGYSFLEGDFTSISLVATYSF